MGAPTSNKRVELNGFHAEDPSSVIKVVETPIPEPGEGEVLVNITLRPINPADVLSVAGYYPGFQPKTLPAVPGLDAVGVVVKNGPGASKFKTSDRVVATPWPSSSGQGTWQQYVVVPESALHAVPDAVSDEVASQFLVNPVTVYGFVKYLERENLIKNGWIVSNAGGSAAGRQFITYAKSKGLKIIAVVRRAELAEELLALGADAVVPTDGSVDVAARIKELTGGEGADAAFEPVGGDLASIVGGLRFGGSLFLYGALGSVTANVNIPEFIFRDVRLRGFWLTNFLLKETSDEERPTVVREVFEAIVDGRLAVQPGGKYFSLDSYLEGIEETNRPGRGGKAFLEG